MEKLNCYFISIFILKTTLFIYIYIYITFIITVGAGSAGTILATRLAEDKQSTVLLLEAGGTAPLFLDIPLLSPMIQKTAYDWQYITVPQEHACKGLINNVNICVTMFFEKSCIYIIIKDFAAKQMA